MSRKSKVMKRALAAKANKKASNGSAVKPQVQGIKKSEKKEVKKSMLLKSIVDKSITVVSSPRATACSNKIEKRKHSKIREPVGTSEVNGDEHVAKTVSQSVVAANKSEEAQKQQTKQSALVISVTPSSKKRRNRKKKSKNNSISGQSTLIVQKKTENMSAEHKKVNGEQQKSVQPKPLLIIERSVSTEETSKKRRKRSRKRKSSTLSSQSESASQQPITKRRRLESGVVTTNNLSPASESSAKRPKHTAEEEVSSDSEPEPIHSDWRLNDVDNREGEKEVEASFSDDEVDLDTSEDDVDEEPVEFAEDSSDEEESSEDSEDSEESYFEEEGQDDQDESDEESDKENDLDSSRYILNGEYPESDDSEDEDFVPVKSSSDEEGTSEESQSEGSVQGSSVDDKVNFSDTHDFSEEDSSKFSEETSDEEVRNYRCILNKDYPESDESDDADFSPVELSSDEEINFSDTYDFSEEDSIRHSEETSDEEGDSQEYDLSGVSSKFEDSRSGKTENGVDSSKYMSNDEYDSGKNSSKEDASGHNLNGEHVSSPKGSFTADSGISHHNEEKALIKESKKVERVKKSSEAVKSATTGNIRGSIKKFSLSNKSAILLEMKERTAEFGKRCLYVAPIPQDCTFDMIKRFIPKVRTCQFFTKPRSTKFRTYAFLEFADAETAEKERLSIMGRLFAGKSIRAEFRSKLRVFIGKTVSDIDFSRIIVTGLAPDVNQMDLKAIFSSAESVRLPRSNNFNLGHATINFVSDAVALDAFSQCHRYPLKAHPITVNFAFKQPSVKNNLTTTTTSAAVVAPSSTSSEAKKASLITQTRAERVGKVIVQQMKEDSETRSEKEEGKKSAFGLMELIEGSKKRTAAGNDDEGDDYSEEEVESGDENEESDGKDDNENDNDDESSENEGGESVDDDDDDDDNNDDMNNVEHGNNNEESSDAGDDDSEGETLDAQLEQVLQARKASAKALKSPGAKRNWKAAHTKKGTRPVGAMPKILPIPSRRRK
ncbi:unnamed protein product [Hymenolepis diminuta]|uniref:RRM domain-containing protein n=1 Tax=Hymenolepis diminuta TaxID=6216 RepID=A0A564XUH4_HYMDI|nr:unnamed protein product [Hymenolepis diminuta]